MPLGKETEGSAFMTRPEPSKASNPIAGFAETDFSGGIA